MEFAQFENWTRAKFDFRELRIPTFANARMARFAGDDRDRFVADSKSDSIIRRYRSIGFVVGEKSAMDKKIEEADKELTSVIGEDDSKLTLAQRFKKMWKQYWYVLLPVHGVMCCAWFGLFYGISVSGLDVISFLEFIHTPDILLDKIKHAPQAGHAVVAFAMYKIATPLRYMTTLGVTYYAVKALSRLGYIKPMPSRKQLKAMIDVKRDEFRERRHRWRQERRFLVFKKRHPTASGNLHPKRKQEE